MIDNAALLESVIAHAAAEETDYDDIAATVDELTDSGDTGLLPRLHEALGQFLDEGNFYGRDLIAAVLAGVAGPVALPVLLLAADRDLGDDQDSLQAEIAGLLDADPVTARELVLALIADDAPERQRAGLLVLDQVAEAGDIDLLAGAASHADADIRLTAVEAVPDPGHDDRAFAVLAAAVHDPDDRVRSAAISRLGASRRPEAVPALTALVGHEHPRTRARIAYALGRLGGTPALLRLLRDDDAHVRDQARDALGTAGDPPAVAALLAEAGAADPRTRAQAAKALAKVADPRAAERLALLAADPDAGVRAAVLSGLATAGARSPLALALAADPDPAVRERVAVVVHHLAPDDAEAVLDRLATDPEPGVRQAVASRRRG